MADTPPPTSKDSADEGTGSDASSVMDLAGQSIGGFEVDRLLGEGGMGAVYLARDVQLEREVALKVLRQRVTKHGSASQVEQFLREARAAAKLNHPNIVQVYQIAESDGQWYIAMEYMEGGCLLRVLRKAGPLNMMNACKYIADVASGLAEAHEAGVIHRDIKPGNLMLTKKGLCKLGDFGLVRFDNPDDPFALNSAAVGTPLFVAPEIVNRQQATAASDIYALAVTMYTMMTGKPPFPGKKRQEIFEHHLNTPPPDLRERLSDASESLAKLVLCCMAKDPAERPTASELSALLKAEISDPSLLEMGNEAIRNLLARSVGSGVHEALSESSGRNGTGKADSVFGIPVHESGRMDRVGTSGRIGAAPGSANGGAASNDQPVSMPAINPEDLSLAEDSASGDAVPVAETTWRSKRAGEIRAAAETEAQARVRRRQRSMLFVKLGAAVLIPVLAIAAGYAAGASGREEVGDLQAYLDLRPPDDRLRSVTLSKPWFSWSMPDRVAARAKLAGPNGESRRSGYYQRDDQALVFLPPGGQGEPLKFEVPSAIMRAVIRQDPEALRAAVERWPELIDRHDRVKMTDQDAERQSVSALAVAVRNQQPELVQILLDAGADPDTGGPHGRPPLLIALADVSTPKVTVVEPLLEAGAEVNVKGEMGTPLDLAAQQDSPLRDELRRLLQKHGATSGWDTIIDN